MFIFRFHLECLEIKLQFFKTASTARVRAVQRVHNTLAI